MLFRSTNGITDICFDKDGDLWLASYQNGLRKLFINNDSISKFEDFKIPGLNNYRIKSIYDNKKGVLYIGHWGEGFTVYNYETNEIKHFSHKEGYTSGLPGNEIMDILIDSYERVWLATHSGLCLYIPENDSFIVYKNNPKIENSLSINEI